MNIFMQASIKNINSPEPSAISNPGNIMPAGNVRFDTFLFDSLMTTLDMHDSIDTLNEKSRDIQNDIISRRNSIDYNFTAFSQNDMKDDNQAAISTTNKESVSKDVTNEGSDENSSIRNQEVQEKDEITATEKRQVQDADNERDKEEDSEKLTEISSEKVSLENCVNIKDASGCKDADQQQSSQMIKDGVVNGEKEVSDNTLHQTVADGEDFQIDHKVPGKDDNLQSELTNRITGEDTLETGQDAMDMTDERTTLKENHGKSDLKSVETGDGKDHVNDDAVDELLKLATMNNDKDDAGGKVVFRQHLVRHSDNELQPSNNVNIASDAGSRTGLNPQQGRFMDNFRVQVGLSSEASGDEASSIKDMAHNTESHGTSLFEHSNATIGRGRSHEGMKAGQVNRTSDFSDLMNKLVYVMKGNNRLGVSVEHERLGRLHLNLSLDKGIVNVHLNTGDYAIREFIANNIHHIVDSLAKDGVNVGGFSVSVRDHEDTGNGGSENPANSDRAGSEDKALRNEYAAHSGYGSDRSGLVNIFA